MCKSHLIVLLPTLVVLCNCGGKPSLTGDWTSEKEISGITNLLSFSSDGTWKQSLGDQKTVVDASGTYVFQDLKLTMTQTKGYQGSKAKQEWSHTIKWISNDKFEFSDTKPPTVFVRKK